MRAGRRRRKGGSTDAATDQTALPNLGGLPPTSDSFQHTRMTYYTEKHARVDEGWRGRSVGPTVDFTVVRTPLRMCFPSLLFATFSLVSPSLLVVIVSIVNLYCYSVCLRPCAGPTSIRTGGCTARSCLNFTRSVGGLAFLPPFSLVTCDAIASFKLYYFAGIPPFSTPALAFRPALSF